MLHSGAAVAACRPWACALAWLASGLAGLIFAAPLRAAEGLTLDAALARIAANHPTLQALELERAALAADARRAGAAPPLTLEAELEDAAGTGERSGLGAAQWTLSLAGVLERGGKRALRQSLAARRIDALAPRRAAAALALLVEGAQRYLDVLAADGELALANDEAVERERWAALARQRSAAGAVPEAVPLLAEAAAARAAFERTRASTRVALAWQRLGVLWGERGLQPQALAADDPYVLPAAPAGDELERLLARNPELEQLAGEGRLRDSQLRLAEAARATDLAWRAGVRRYEDGDDWALVAGVSVPLGARARAEPEIAAARATLDALALERAAGERRLLGALLEARGVYLASKLESEQLRDELLPRLDAAAAAAERAWRAGALGPSEWSDLQQARFDARRARLAAAIAARRALIEIQGLTAEPLR